MPEHVHGRHVLRYVPVKHVPVRHELKHMPKHVLIHVLGHVPQNIYVLELNQSQL